MLEGEERVMLRILKIKLKKRKRKEEIMEALEINEEKYYELIKKHNKNI
jgi:hypothetical protein